MTSCLERSKLNYFLTKWVTMSTYGTIIFLTALVDNTKVSLYRVLSQRDIVSNLGGCYHWLFFEIHATNRDDEVLLSLLLFKTIHLHRKLVPLTSIKHPYIDASQAHILIKTDDATFLHFLRLKTIAYM